MQQRNSPRGADDGRQVYLNGREAKFLSLSLRERNRENFARGAAAAFLPLGLFNEGHAAKEDERRGGGVYT